MKLALDEAKKSATDFDEVPIGAIIVKDNKVIARAGNRTRTDNDPTAHAEILALRQAAQILGNFRLNGCDLYVTLEPCTMCAGAISHARIENLYIAAWDEKGGAVKNGVCFFDQKTCHYKPQIHQGSYARASRKLLQDFFKSKR